MWRANSICHSSLSAHTSSMRRAARVPALAQGARKLPSASRRWRADLANVVVQHGRRWRYPCCGSLARRRSLSSLGEDPFKSTDPKQLLKNPLGVLDPFKLVQSQLNDLTGNIGQLLRTAGDNPVLDAVATYFFQSDTRAKHFRPSVVLLVARATAANSKMPHQMANESQQRLAEIAEMIHTASLLHDDVIDESDERRGVGSGNAVFGNKVAVLAGDFLLARASMALARMRNTEVVEVVSLVIEELVEGELLQIRVGAGSEKGLSARELMKMYLRKNYLKTGSLIANSAKASAMLGAHDETICTAAYDYGRHLGLAFQLVDDALDFRASSDALGKPAMADIQLGLATAPVLLAMETHPQLVTLVERRCREPGDLEQAMAWVIEAGGVRKTEKLAGEYAQKAVAAIKQLEPSEPRDALVALAQMTLTRRR